MKSVRKLSLDAMLSMAARLDTFSIVTLLQAQPELKKHAVIITDHHQPLMFFNVPGVQRRDFYCHSDTHERLQTYDPAVDTQPIKLVEVVYSSGFYNVCHEEFQSTFPRVNSFSLDSLTFLYMGGHVRLCDISTAVGVLDRHGNGAKIHTGAPLWFSSEAPELFRSSIVFHRMAPDVPAEPRGLSLSCLGASIFDGLKSLRVNQVPALQDIEFPDLLDLYVDFSSIGSTKPLISNITAPKLLNFVVHYRDRLPAIDNVFVLDAEPADTYRLQRTFELGDVRGMDKGCSFSVKKHTTPNDIARLNLDFLVFFDTLNFFGVPDAVIEKANLSTIVTFQWHKTLNEPMSAPYLLKMPMLEYVVISVSAPHSRLPKLLLKDKLTTFSLFIEAEDVHVSDFWPMMPSCFEFTVCRSLSLASDPNLSHKLLDHDKWVHWARAIGVFGTIKLEGFEIPLIEDPSTQSMSWPHVYNLRLCPVVSRQQIRDPSRYNVYLPARSIGALDVSPIMLDLDSKKMALHIHINFSHPGGEPEINSATMFQSYQLNELFLPLTPTESWVGHISRFNSEVSPTDAPEVVRYRWTRPIAAPAEHARWFEDGIAEGRYIWLLDPFVKFPTVSSKVYYLNEGQWSKIIFTMNEKKIRERFEKIICPLLREAGYLT